MGRRDNGFRSPTGIVTNRGKQPPLRPWEVALIVSVMTRMLVMSIADARSYRRGGRSPWAGVERLFPAMVAWAGW